MSTRNPHRISDVLSELMARRGYGQVRSVEALEQAWREIAGEALARHSRVGVVRRGVLEIQVANSAELQELTFVRDELLKRLAERLPEQKIRQLRFRLGTV